ncbi:response regulator transcription factor [Sulfurospirillum deleyianum]|uniref:Response regulator receiver n=1 Tax=Sulfurospirillum deleyianum (strain ATCC 51133 / DSM 6946 / 5175) TaxID=525898 RepID=D1B283_SULD5|nr:response regulator transcription factor [Sulfurospirillum deleyianum]ACZ12203.1 response regulator receiver [Sulfurospirillum deleyianum DSM 6946]
MKILVLEDNVRLLRTIKIGLENENFKVDTFTDGEEALSALTNGYSCFIFDINVPSLSGLDVLEYLRINYKDTPVIMISSDVGLEKIKKSYEFGCNDYIKKPFFVYELVQKIKNLCKNETQIISLGEGFTFDCKNHILLHQTTEIKLSKQEILFLELLSKKRNKTYSYYEIEEYVWEGKSTTEGNIRALVKRLRLKIPPKSIQVIKGVGYSLVCS